MTSQGGKYSRSARRYRGVIGTGRTIWKEEGLRGMYRGLGPMLLGYLPTWAVYLTVYENTRESYYDMCGSWWLARCYSSLTAGACSTILTNPIWVIKTRLMSQSSRVASDGMRAPWHYTSTWDAAKKMYKHEGLGSFYSGLKPAILGLSHVAVQFPLYEYLKMRFTGYGMGEHPVHDTETHWLGITAATFLSKIAASTITYPHEVLRTRLQTQQRNAPSSSFEGIGHRGSLGDPLHKGRLAGYASSDGMMPLAERYRGLIQTCRVILREEGWTAFYAGIGTNLIRAVPAAMTTMITYEWLQKVFHDAQEEGANLKRGSDRDGYAH